MHLISLTYVIEPFKPMPKPNNANDANTFAGVYAVANTNQPIAGIKLVMAIAFLRPNRSAINPDKKDPNG